MVAAEPRKALIESEYAPIRAEERKNAEEHPERRGRRSARRDAEDERVRELVAHERLHRHARHGERRADRHAEQHARQPQAHDDALVDRAPRMFYQIPGEGQTRGEYPQRIAGRDRNGAEPRGESGGQNRRRGENREQQRHRAPVYQKAFSVVHIYRLSASPARAGQKNHEDLFERKSETFVIRSYFFRKAPALRDCRTDAPPFRAFVARRCFRERESKIAHAASFVNAARNARPRRAFTEES